MTDESVAIAGPGGETLLRYLPGVRGDRQIADLAEVGDNGVQAAANAALRELRGWALATRDEDLARTLIAQGATLRRHAHVHSRDLTVDPPPTEWATASVREGLHVTPWDRPLEEIAPVLLAAYPVGHVDHSPRASIADVVAEDLQPYAVDGVLGPRLPSSGLVLEGETVVANLLVNERPGNAPDGGPWVTDVARLPGTAYAGTGRALLQRALAGLAAAGAPALSLTVSEGNPARALYESLGITHAYSAMTVSLPD